MIYFCRIWTAYREKFIDSDLIYYLITDKN